LLPITITTKENNAMSKYTVNIIETLQREIEVEAKSREEAEDIVRSEWRREEHVLDADDFCSVTFGAVQTNATSLSMEIGSCCKDRISDLWPWR
jgi:hypothetical protein